MLGEERIELAIYSADRLTGDPRVHRGSAGNSTAPRVVKKLIDSTYEWREIGEHATTRQPPNRISPSSRERCCLNSGFSV
jgi:hypothetical protein